MEEMSNYVYGGASPSQEDIAGMRALMLDDLDDTPSNMVAETFQPQPTPFDNYEVSYDVNDMTPAASYSAPAYSSKATVTKKLAPNSRSIYMYDVIMGGKPMVTGVWMAESANAIANLLNEGCAINDERLFTIISSCVVYNKAFTTLKEKYTERAKVLRECRYDEAKVIDATVAKLKQDAENMRAKTISYMDRQGINYK